MVSLAFWKRKKQNSNEEKESLIADTTQRKSWISRIFSSKPKDLQLLEAIQKGKLEKANKLLDLHGDALRKLIETRYISELAGGSLLLDTAANSDSWELVKKLFDLVTKPQEHFASSELIKMLQMAANDKDWDTFQRLTEMQGPTWGMMPQIVQKTAIELAAKNDQKKLVENLLNKYLSEKEPYGNYYQELFNAAFNAKNPTINEAVLSIALGKTLGTPTLNEYCFTKAIQYGNMSAMNTLIAREIQPSEKHLLLAARHGHWEMVAELLQRQDVQAIVTANNNQILKLAAEANQTEIVKRLLTIPSVTDENNIASATDALMEALVRPERWQTADILFQNEKIFKHVQSNPQKYNFHGVELAIQTQIRQSVQLDHKPAPSYIQRIEQCLLAISQPELFPSGWVPGYTQHNVSKAPIHNSKLTTKEKRTGLSP